MTEPYTDHPVWFGDYTDAVIGFCLLGVLMKKMCVDCRRELSIDLFGSNKCSFDKKNARCKECVNKRGSKYRRANFREIRERQKNARLKNIKESREKDKIRREKYKTKRKLYVKKYRKTHAEEIRNWRKEYDFKRKKEIAEWRKQYNKIHRDEIKKKTKKYRDKNKQKINATKRKRYHSNIDKYRSIASKYQKAKWKTDFSFRILHALRNRLRKVVKSQNAKKCDHTIVLLGCSKTFLKRYIESKFEKGMSWSNYGRLYDQWQIDHIRPCSSFKLIDPKEQRKCFHYTNLRPLWNKDNWSKNSKYLGKRWLNSMNFS